MAIYCEVCGGQLSTWTKNRICSDRCRAKRSRDKREALKRAYDMAFTVDNWAKLLSQEVITADEADRLLNVIWDRLLPLYRQVNDARAKAEGKPAEADEEYEYED